jgi:hypothetical protein
MQQQPMINAMIAGRDIGHEKKRGRSKIAACPRLGRRVAGACVAMWIAVAIYQA